MGTYMLVLHKSFQMNTNMTGFGWFSKFFEFLCLRRMWSQHWKGYTYLVKIKRFQGTTVTAFPVQWRAKEKREELRQASASAVKVIPLQKSCNSISTRIILESSDFPPNPFSSWCPYSNPKTHFQRQVSLGLWGIGLSTCSSVLDGISFHFRRRRNPSETNVQICSRQDAIFVVICRDGVGWDLWEWGDVPATFAVYTMAPLRGLKHYPAWGVRSTSFESHQN